MDIETSEQLAFIPEQVESILMTVVDGILRTEVYLEEKVRLLSFWDQRTDRQKNAHRHMELNCNTREPMGLATFVVTRTSAGRVGSLTCSLQVAAAAGVDM